MAARAAGDRIISQPATRDLPRTSETRIARTGRIAGLDGLRAIAVLLVVLYHFAPVPLPGGYLGVDVFFVLSGFLITTILLAERDATGGVSLRRFWRHRARRLLPALAAVVVVCVAAVAVALGIDRIGGASAQGSLWSDLLVGVGAQIAAAATFTSNWLTVLTEQSYAAASSPHLFGNLWSLAVEEQFYLVWPLVVVGVIGAGLAVRKAAYGAAALALGSAGAMALLLDLGSDPTRVYVGTDTHAFGLMIGAALAFWWNASRQGTRPAWWPGRRPALAAGFGGALAIAALAALMPWDTALPYRGGLLLASVATAAVIVALVTVPATGRALDAGPLRWIGERSYGIYLWHWPVFVILATGIDGGRLRDASWPTLVLASVITVAVSAACYRWLEVPVRRRGFRAALRGLVDWLYPVEHDRSSLQAARRRRAAVFGGTVAAVLALAASAVAEAPEQTTLETQLDEGAKVAAETSASAAPAATPTAASTAVAAPSPSSGASSPASGASSPTPAPVVEVPDGARVQVIGDSVTVGSAGALAEALPGIRITAEVGKQFATGVDQVARLAGEDRLRDYLVVALGTNGRVGAENLERLLAAAGERPVVLVTPYGDRSWIPGAVADLRAAAEAHPTVVLADWNAAVAQDTSVLGPDGIHPRAGGVELFVSVIEDALERAAAL
ncbi:acyltransferase family protein [Demequina sp. SYSU T00068]|uniref:acyltransferase family protein n=1 Tax=Demequina lignilytica TaxID=3051663 RepID=UPI00262386CC|nr:acyltransferase family protein [Demequina sp. SYSU T00068]MDN4489743.1 acyltransferase family protein [Demequina sp. SYSU T00068]